MSKEKNLTWGNMMVIHNQSGPFVYARDHIYVCERDEANTGELLSKVEAIKGPAIDRLHAFEKIGMEPEEIRGRLEATEEYIETFKKDLAWYKGQHGVLQVQHSNQAATIRELTEENEELRQQIKFLEETIEKFGVEELKKDLDLAIKKNRNLVQANSTLFVKKADLESEVYELKEEIAERERNEERLHEVIKNQNEYIEQLKAKFDPGLTCKQVISQLRERIQELDRICGVQKDVIDARDKTINDLEERLHTMKFRNDNQYRSLQAMRKENDELRDMNQRQYDNIAELQKENETLKHAIDKIRIDAELAETHRKLSK